MGSCFHRLFPPPERDRPPGWGDCKSCVASPENVNCRGWRETHIVLHRLDVTGDGGVLPIRIDDANTA